MNDKLRQLRVNHKMTQEDLAEKMNVSRQSVAKWENGESIPDILKCSELAKIFEVSIEDIARIFTNKSDDVFANPKGKYVFGLLRVSEDHTIVIPEEARRVFNIKSGDDLLLLGDIDQGMALMPMNEYNQFINQIMSAPVFEEGKENDSNKNR